MSSELNPVEIEAEQILPENNETVEQSEEQTAEQADNGETAASNQNSTPILYNLNISPVVRCVKIVARLINLELELRYVNILNKKSADSKKFRKKSKKIDG